MPFPAALLVGHPIGAGSGHSRLDASPDDMRIFAPKARKETDDPVAREDEK